MNQKIKTICRMLIILAILIGIGLYLIRFHKSEEAKLSAHFMDDREAFVDSVIALNKARDLSQPSEGFKGVTFDLPEDVETEIFLLTEKGINLSREVSDEFLDYLHPELRTMYRQKLIKGTELWFEGVKMSEQTSGVEKQISGDVLITEWLDWFEDNDRSFENKIFD